MAPKEGTTNVSEIGFISVPRREPEGYSAGVSPDEGGFFHNLKGTIIATGLLVAGFVLGGVYQKYVPWARENNGASWIKGSMETSEGRRKLAEKLAEDPALLGPLHQELGDTLDQKQRRLKEAQRFWQEKVSPQPLQSELER